MSDPPCASAKIARPRRPRSMRPPCVFGRRRGFCPRSVAGRFRCTPRAPEVTCSRRDQSGSDLRVTSSTLRHEARPLRRPVPVRRPTTTDCGGERQGRPMTCGSKTGEHGQEKPQAGRPLASHGPKGEHERYWGTPATTAVNRAPAPCGRLPGALCSVETSSQRPRSKRSRHRFRPSHPDLFHPFLCAPRTPFSRASSRARRGWHCGTPR